jgi:hypothetical protein
LMKDISNIEKLKCVKDLYFSITNTEFAVWGRK